jgi:hypothetical protein
VIRGKLNSAHQVHSDIVTTLSRHSSWRVEVECRIVLLAVALTGSWSFSRTRNNTKTGSPAQAGSRTELQDER